MKDNSKLANDVLEELAWDARLDARHVDAGALDGIVTLRGSVASYAEKWAAERAAERVDGVKAVANELSVVVPAELAQADADLAAAVVNALAWDVRVPDTRIKSSVTDGWVTLEGEVEWSYQREAAAKAVRNLVGVQGVSNNIAIVPKTLVPHDVRESIKAALERRADDTVDHIRVEAKGSVVTLRGSVPSFAEREAAERAAWSAPGVTEVHDDLAVMI